MPTATAPTPSCSAPRIRITSSTSSRTCKRSASIATPPTSGGRLPPLPAQRERKHGSAASVLVGRGRGRRGGVFRLHHPFEARQAVVEVLADHLVHVHDQRERLAHEVV